MDSGSLVLWRHNLSLNLVKTYFHNFYASYINLPVKFATWIWAVSANYKVDENLAITLFSFLHDWKL